MDIWIDFKKKEVKNIRTLQDLTKLLQNSQKYSQKGHFESWAPIGSWNSLYGMYSEVSIIRPGRSRLLEFEI